MLLTGNRETTRSDEAYTFDEPGEDEEGEDLRSTVRPINLFSRKERRCGYRVIHSDRSSSKEHRPEGPNDQRAPDRCQIHSTFHQGASSSLALC